jgi:hypothetical protein
VAVLTNKEGFANTTYVADHKAGGRGPTPTATVSGGTGAVHMVGAGGRGGSGALEAGMAVVGRAAGGNWAGGWANPSLLLKWPSKK